jgi:hypothetical protein
MKNKKIKVSCLWVYEGHVASTLIFNLIQKLSNKEIIFTDAKSADILFIGPCDIISIPRRIINSLTRRLNFKQELKKKIEYLRQSTILRKNQPIKIFLNHENFRHDEVESDFTISFDLGVNNPNHIRIPVWKENIDWSNHGIKRNEKPIIGGKEYLYLNILRFGYFYNVDDLLRPQGDNFLKKKNICMFSTYMPEPRKTIYEEFSKSFKVDGYGPYFDKDLKTHNEGNFTKSEIMKNYAFNLCPHNNNYPGQYEEKVPEAFLSKCLPITWADQNIDTDFNIKSFINLNDHIKDNFKEIIYLLQQKEFLKSFTEEPLILKKPNLEKEIEFAKKIIDYL